MMIRHYFPHLTEAEHQALEKLIPAYEEWNQKINVVSRKDIDNLEIHHILHSLAIAKYLSFPDHCRVLDLGSGGGFPGIPLAIVFPNVEFDLVDSTMKKMRVAAAVSDVAGLKNVHTIHERVENLKTSYDYVICRAVARIDKLVKWSSPLLKHSQIKSSGLIALKGGGIAEELEHIVGYQVHVESLSQWFSEQYFEEKYLVHIKMQ